MELRALFLRRWAEVAVLAAAVAEHLRRVREVKDGRIARVREDRAARCLARCVPPPPPPRAPQAGSMATHEGHRSAFRRAKKVRFARLLTEEISLTFLRALESWRFSRRRKARPRAAPRGRVRSCPRLTPPLPPSRTQAADRIVELLRAVQENSRFKFLCLLFHSRVRTAQRVLRGVHLRYAEPPPRA